MGSYDDYIADGSGLDSLSTAVKAIMGPIGGIVAWAKTMASVPQTLPVGWVECDGAVISDADSPLDGETLPDLNGTTEATKKFLQGEATSGAEAGSSVFNHSHEISFYHRTGGSGGSSYPTYSLTGYTSKAIIPPCYDVVWIIRIK